MYKRSLNILKMLVLQGSCTWTSKILSFICCDCAYEAISLSQLSQLSPQPASAIDYLGHCQREIRTRLTVCWLMLNQDKTHMMPVCFKEEFSLCTEKDLFPFHAACIPAFVLHITDTGLHQLPQLPWNQQLSPRKLSAWATSQGIATICFRWYPFYHRSFSQNQVMATYSTQKSVLTQFNSTGQYRV